ncbi:MAG: hypothetical protein EZS28_017177 [Streblomastix strix]|uniref:Uncharacterized protein n=1 Tax=Streblomastix strix TaxID=222440 RepID=A0A5J4VXE4_9EUKA|nr:MAG: hypothetical protein EZS28_017177 [Streblomastix strix]
MPINSSATGDFAFLPESGTVWMYESSSYDSGQLVLDQVTPASDQLLIVNGTASAGISTSYSRGDHIHPQQLTYDNDITANKFFKTGGTNQQILLVNGTNKAITDFNPSVAPRAYQIDPADGGIINGIAQINPNTANYSQGLRISRSGAGCGIYLGTGTGATSGANNRSVNYSAGNPILWGVNSTGTEGGFYSDGAKVYWRAHPLTMGSVPQ